MSSPFHPRIGRPRPDRPRAHWRPAGSRAPSYPSSARRSTSAKGTWAKAPKRGLDLSLPRVRRGGGEAGQEAGEGSRRGQVRDLPAQGRRTAQAHFVQVDGGRREELRGLAAVLGVNRIPARTGSGQILRAKRSEMAQRVTAASPDHDPLADGTSRQAAQPIAAPVFEDERNRVGQAAVRLDLCVALAVRARDLRTVRDVPLAVAFEDRGEFISPRPFRFLTLHLDFSGDGAAILVCTPDKRV